jgi:low affinity Fe/Cu permease
VRERFRRFAVAASEWAGSPVSFCLHVLVSLYALIGGGDLVVLLLTISTALIAVIVLQTALRSEKAIMVKLDALIVVNNQLSNRLTGIEDRTEDELEAIRAEVKQAAE